MGLVVFQYSLLCFAELLIALAFNAFHDIDDKKRKQYLFVALGILAVITMFHGSSMGNDTSNYLAMFNRIARSESPLAYALNTSTETGFIFYCWVLSRISSNPRILFIVSGAIVYLSLGRFIYKNVKNPGMMCYLMVSIKVFDFFISAQRQAMSIAILLVAFEFFKEKKTVKFLLLSILAVLFHNTAIAFILIYFLVNFRLMKVEKMGAKFYMTWSVIIAALFLFFERFWNLMLTIFPKYLYYTGGALVDGEPRLAVALKIAVYGLMYLIANVFLPEGEKRRKDVHIYTLLAFLNLAITIVAWNATAINRLCADFMFFAIIHYSRALDSNKAYYKYNHVVLVGTTVAAFFIYGLVIVWYKTPAWYTTYPFDFRF